MLSLVRSTILMLLIITAVTGFVYPAVVTVLAQAMFPRQANGSLVIDRGRVVGSELIGEAFTDPRYFWPRPSATPEFAYNAAQSSGSNLGPLSVQLKRELDERVRALHASDPTNHQPIPADLVTASGSGLDPDISPEAARWQAPRVARERRLSPAILERLIDEHISRPPIRHIGRASRQRGRPQPGAGCAEIEDGSLLLHAAPPARPR